MMNFRINVVILQRISKVPMETVVKKPRLEWLDALRGFTMILVVANHVSRVGFEQNWKFSSSLPFLLLFRMPLFFFISGFLAYKTAQVWNASTFKQLVTKKVKVQIIPTVIFFFLYNAVVSPNFIDGVIYHFHAATKGGYWFTIVLLWMFLIYYVFSYLESKLRIKSCVPILTLFVISLCFYETCYMPKLFPWAQGYKGEPIQWLNDTSINQIFYFFPFFLFGNIVHRYWDKAQQVMDSKWFYPTVIVVVILSTMDVLKWHNLRFEWTNLPSTLAKFGLLTIVFMYFRYYKDHFTKRSVVGISLQYIGRRTLDIYLIHFLFLPNLPTIGSFFDKYRHNFVLDTTVSVFIALLVIGFCIITSNILRVSPFLRKYLFGR
jgi:fucose 4-O-acetylase-like acetyltransferase